MSDGEIIQAHEGLELPFRVVPLGEAKGFTVREIPDFMREGRGAMMKAAWESLNSVGVVDDLIGRLKKIVSRSRRDMEAEQIFSIGPDQLPLELRNFLGDGEVSFSYNVDELRHGYLGRVNMSTNEKKGSVDDFRQVEIDFRLNRPYELVFKELATVGGNKYVAERITGINRTDMNDSNQFERSDLRTISYPSFTEVEVQVSGKRVNPPDVSREDSVFQDRPGRIEVGAYSYGGEQKYFDRVVPLMSMDEQEGVFGVVIKESEPNIERLSQLFPVDSSWDKTGSE